MSMFSRHYVIAHGAAARAGETGSYWNGSGWTDPDGGFGQKIVRFHDCESARLVLTGVLSDTLCHIEEDE